MSDLLGQMERLVDGGQLRGDCAEQSPLDLLACIWTLEATAALSFADAGTLFFMSGEAVGLRDSAAPVGAKPSDEAARADARSLLLRARGPWSLRWGLSALTGFSRSPLRLTDLLLSAVTDHPLSGALSAHAVSEWSGRQVRFDTFRPLLWRDELKPAIQALQRGVRADRAWLSDDALRAALLTICDHLGGLEEVSFIGEFSFADPIEGEDED